jgi:hypothetical protein
MYNLLGNTKLPSVRVQATVRTLFSNVKNASSKKSKKLVNNKPLKEKTRKSKDVKFHLKFN